MQGPLSRIEQAQRETLLHKAEGVAFDELAAFYELARPVTFEREHWRAGLRAVVFGSRGTASVTHAWLEAVLASLPALSVAVSLDPAHPQRVTAAAGTPFLAKHTSRLVRVVSPTFGSRLYWSTGPDFSVPGASDRLELCRLRTARWAAADWSTLAAVENATATVLPFVYIESTPGPIDQDNIWGGTFTGAPCLLKVFLDDELFYVPPTYLQDLGAARPVGEPFGGHAQPSAMTQGDQVIGPFPPYLIDPSQPELTALLDVQLPAGVHARVLNVDFADLATWEWP